MTASNVAISIIFAAVTLFLFLALVSLHDRWANRSNRLPLTKRYLRPPGESLRLKLVHLDDITFDFSLWLLVLGFVVGFGVYQCLTQSWVAGGIIISIALSGMIWWVVRFERHAGARRDHYLGFLGERAVGEELNQLLAKGWFVFHDVPFHDNPAAKEFNVDHVVVGMGGLYAIETKTRRKRKESGGHEVTFDGRTLLYPWGAECWGIKNARDRARHLGQWLSKQLAKPISAAPVLALPGWMVHRRSASDLRVVSSGEIATLFAGEELKPCFDPATVHAIKALLEQKCRDVEA